jgi:hypothetical protein
MKGKSMGNTLFDTNRFVENTTLNQMKNGTIQFMDTQNPGVYYTAHRNGNINRVIRTNETVVVTDGTNTTEQFIRPRTRYTQVNYRNPSNGSFVKLHRLSDQLGRIQEVGAFYSTDQTMNVVNADGQTIITTPR